MAWAVAGWFRCTVTPQGVQLGLVPGVELVELCLKVVGPGGDQVAPQLAALLPQGDGVAPAGGAAGGLHAYHAAPHHQDGLLLPGGDRAEGGLPGGLGVHGAAGAAADLQGPDAPLVAADAGADLLGTSMATFRGSRGRPGGPAQNHPVHLPSAMAWAARAGSFIRPPQRMGIFTCSFTAAARGSPGPSPCSRGARRSRRSRTGQSPR